MFNYESNLKWIDIDYFNDYSNLTSIDFYPSVSNFQQFNEKW